MPVFKRNTTVPLPLSRHPKPSGCTVDEKAIARLPGPLRAAEAAYRAFLDGSTATVDSPRKFVVVTGGQLQGNGRATYLDRLRTLASAFDWSVVDAPDVSPKELHEATRAAAFIDVLAVDTDDSPFGGVFIQLVRPRDRALLWAERLPLPPNDAQSRSAAEAVARRLPRTFTLFRVDKTIILRATGTIPAPPAGHPLGGVQHRHTSGGASDHRR
jgi:hypothetical protein